ncbi:hypothetical protein B0T17DRAFT_299828 [Bombardia bombarda]|uniref:Uncharacterized protein n=1 Tax=Bombardia bombarda TaxID=252184 RepID=A0AA40C1A5_9PEZI|nr:hypothetical protein B0T17DRAFT_299828 [Bombardia bombarda]
MRRQPNIAPMFASRLTRSKGVTTGRIDEWVSAVKGCRRPKMPRTPQSPHGPALSTSPHWPIDSLLGAHPCTTSTTRDTPRLLKQPVPCRDTCAPPDRRGGCELSPCPPSMSAVSSPIETWPYHSEPRCTECSKPGCPPHPVCILYDNLDDHSWNSPGHFTVEPGPLETGNLHLSLFLPSPSLSLLQIFL